MAILTGAGDQAYTRDGLNHYSIHELLAPFHQVACFCGMRWLPPFVVFGTLQEGDVYCRGVAESYRAALGGLRDGTLGIDHLPPDSLLNDALTRTQGRLDAR